MEQKAVDATQILYEWLGNQAGVWLHCGNTHRASLPLNQTGAIARQQGSEPSIKNVKISCVAAEFDEYLAISFAKNAEGFLSTSTAMGNFSSRLALETKCHSHLGVVKDPASVSISARETLVALYPHELCDQLRRKQYWYNDQKKRKPKS